MPHNPFFEASAESLQTGMDENARQSPDKALEVKRVIEEDDPGFAPVHIFRVENGRIVELRDLGQPVPEKSPNQYGMF